MNAYLRSVDRRSDALGQLGDLVCVEGDCKLGESLVAQMSSFYKSLYDDPATRDAVRQKYHASVLSIVAARDNLETWARRWVPFHPNCCAIRDVGKQAQDLTAQMAKDFGLAAPASVPVAWTDSGGVIGNATAAIWGIAKLALLVGGGLYVWKTVATMPASRSPARR